MKKIALRIEPASPLSRLIPETVARLDPSALLAGLAIGQDQAFTHYAGPLNNEDEVRAAAGKMNGAHRKDLKQVLLRLGGPDYADNIRRVWRNKGLTLPSRALGVALQPLTDLQTSLSRADHFNPLSNTATVYSGLPAVTMHELGHAVDFNRKPKGLRDLYTFLTLPERNILPGTGPATLWMESQANRHVLSALASEKNKPKRREREREAWRRLTPAFGTYLAGAGLSGLYLKHLADGAGPDTGWSKYRDFVRENPWGGVLGTLAAAGIGGRLVAEGRNLGVWLSDKLAERKKKMKKQAATTEPLPSSGERSAALLALLSPTLVGAGIGGLRRFAAGGDVLPGMAEGAGAGLGGTLGLAGSAALAAPSGMSNTAQIGTMLAGTTGGALLGAKTVRMLEQGLERRRLRKLMESRPDLVQQYPEYFQEKAAAYDFAGTTQPLYAPQDWSQQTAEQLAPAPAGRSFGSAANPWVDYGAGFALPMAADMAVWRGVKPGATSAAGRWLNHVGTATAPLRQSVWNNGLWSQQGGALEHLPWNPFNRASWPRYSPRTLGSNILKTNVHAFKNIGTSLSNIGKLTTGGLSEIGTGFRAGLGSLAKNEGARVAGTIAAKGAAKGAAKLVPFAGGALGIGLGINNLRKGNIASGLLDIGGGVANIALPGAGSLLVQAPLSVASAMLEKNSSAAHAIAMHFLDCLMEKKAYGIAGNMSAGGITPLGVADDYDANSAIDHRIKLLSLLAGGATGLKVGQMDYTRRQDDATLAAQRAWKDDALSNTLKANPYPLQVPPASLTPSVLKGLAAAIAGTGVSYGVGRYLNPRKKKKKVVTA